MPRDIGYIVRKRAFKGTRGGTRVSLSIFRSMDQLREPIRDRFWQIRESLTNDGGQGKRVERESSSLILNL